MCEIPSFAGVPTVAVTGSVGDADRECARHDGFAGYVEKPFRAETLARQAAAWTLPELETALDGLLELDATVKGAGGAMANERARRLAFTLWLAERVAPR